MSDYIALLIAKTNHRTTAHFAGDKTLQRWKVRSALRIPESFAFWVTMWTVLRLNLKFENTIRVWSARRCCNKSVKGLSSLFRHFVCSSQTVLQNFTLLTEDDTRTVEPSVAVQRCEHFWGWKIWFICWTIESCSATTNTDKTAELYPGCFSLAKSPGWHYLVEAGSEILASITNDLFRIPESSCTESAVVSVRHQ